MEEQTVTPPKSEVSEELVHEFTEEKSSTPMKNKLLIVVCVAVLLGLLSGFLLSKEKTGGGVTAFKQTTGEKSASVAKGDVFGVKDDKVFKDSAEGELKVGGIDGEGAYHLERPGGDSQSVYLTSSTIDLSLFVGRKVKVWGETNTAQKAGWLMDVGRLQIL
jgi:hypothetical protein